MGTFNGLLSGMTEYTPEEERQLPRRYAKEAKEIEKVLAKNEYFGRKIVYARVRDLDDVYAKPWHAGRLREAVQAFKEGRPLLPITIQMNDYGKRVLDDGNHRLAAARQVGAEFILAIFGCPPCEEC